MAQGHLGGSSGLVPGGCVYRMVQCRMAGSSGFVPGVLFATVANPHGHMHSSCLLFTMALKLAEAFAAHGFPGSLQEALVVAELCVTCDVECLEDLDGCSESPLQDCDVAVDIEVLAFLNDMVDVASRAGGTSNS